MKDARKLENERPRFLDGDCSIGCENVQKSPHEKSVVTKSKARRLRKKKKSKEVNDNQLQTLQSNSKNLVCTAAVRDPEIFSLDNKPCQDETEVQESEEEQEEHEDQEEREEHDDVDDEHNYNALISPSEEEQLWSIVKLTALLFNQKLPETVSLEFRKYLKRSIQYQSIENHSYSESRDTPADTIQSNYVCDSVTPFSDREASNRFYSSNIDKDRAGRFTLDFTEGIISNSFSNVEGCGSHEVIEELVDQTPVPSEVDVDGNLSCGITIRPYSRTAQGEGNGNLDDKKGLESESCTRIVGALELSSSGCASEPIACPSRLLAIEDIKDNPTFRETRVSDDAVKMVDPKESAPNEREKSKEDVKAEREARKAMKAAAKAKAKATKTGQSETTTNKKLENARVSQSAKETKGATKSQLPSESPVVSDVQDILNRTKNTEMMEEESGGGESKSKAQLRAERRAKQEAQRAAKQRKQQEATQEPLVQTAKHRETVDKKSSTSDRASKQPSKSPNAVPTSSPTCTEQSPASKHKGVSKKFVATTTNKDAHEANLFKHLYHERELAFVVAPSIASKIHPCIVRLGVQYANKVIVGSNARCVALLAAVKQLLLDFERPSQADFIRSLEASLQESVAYLHHCRPTAVSMQNALRHLKWQMTQLPSTISDADAKTKLESAIDTYILEQIQLAGKAISITIQRKISNGDVILTYGYSSLINKILLDAHAAGKKFRVIVVDGRPWLEGKEQLRRLAKHGVECSYILINALSFVMPEVSKVFLGAHAILANGAVMSRVGTAQVALMARAFNVPVLVACETHKSSERVQTDSIVYNELGNPDDLANFTAQGSPTRKPLLTNWKSKRSLNLLNITYDVTPADLVTAVVTELAILPCTSVPVILRIKPSEI